MPIITNSNTIIEDGSPSKIVKNLDGTINYVEYTVGAQVFRMTATYVDAQTVTYSIPTLQV